MNYLILTLLLCCTLLFKVNAQTPLTESLSLKECIEIAKNNNLKIKSAKLDVESQKINLKQSRNNALPTLNGNGNTGYNWGRGIDPTTNSFINQQVGFISLSANANYRLYSGFKRRRETSMNTLQLEATQIDVENTKDQVSFQVIEAYMNLIFTKELLKNADFLVKSDSQRITKTTLLVENGALTKSALLDIKAQYSTSLVKSTNARNQVSLAELTLRQLLNISDNQVLSIKDIPFSIDSLENNATNLLNTETLVAHAEAYQNDIKASKTREKVAEENEKIAQSGYMPTLTLSGSLRTNYSDARDKDRNIIDGRKDVVVDIGRVKSSGEAVVTQTSVPNVVGVDSGYPISDQFNDNFTQSLSLNLSIPIFSGFRNKNNVQRARVQKMQAMIRTSQLKQNLHQQIEKARVEAIGAYKDLKSQQQNVTALQESFRMQQIQFELGASNSFDLEIAKNNLFIAQNNLSRSKYSLLLKQKVLQFYASRSI